MSSPSGDRSTEYPHFAIILAGGAGTRLWPLSRESRPKQFAPLLGGASLLKKTIERVLPVIPPSRIIVVTQESQLFETQRQLREISPELADHVMSEPVGRNTLPAVAWATLKIAEMAAKTSEDALISVFPSDHLIRDQEAFQSSWEEALRAAQEGFLVTFGIRPETPETGYGYIEMGEPLPSGTALRAKAFVEKPDLATAQKYLSSGRYLWNSGMFAFSADTFLKELKEHQPQIDSALRNNADYASLPPLSMDYGLLEKSRRVAVVPSDFSWTDLGSWDAVYRALDKDASLNATKGRVVAKETESCLLIAEQGLIGAVGLKNTAVIQSGDMLLVADLSRSQKVRDLLEDVRKSQKCADKWITTTRPWGTYTVLEEGRNFKIKKIVVNPAQKLSLQRHKNRAEHWVVIEGTAKVTCGEKAIEMKANQSTFIPQGEKHRLENPGSSPLIIIEVQTGSYLGEDDIERFDDVYGRK